MNDLDSRTARATATRALVRHQGVILYGQPLYCLSCGRQDGWVTRDLPDGVFYLCDGCEQRYGVPEVLQPRPDLDEARVI